MKQGGKLSQPSGQDGIMFLYRRAEHEVETIEQAWMERFL